MTDSSELLKYCLGSRMCMCLYICLYRMASGNIEKRRYSTRTFPAEGLVYHMYGGIPSHLVQLFFQIIVVSIYLSGDTIILIADSVGNLFASYLSQKLTRDT